jgi:hypothetical protein
MLDAAISPARSVFFMPNAGTESEDAMGGTA